MKIEVEVELEEKEKQEEEEPYELSDADICENEEETEELMQAFNMAENITEEWGKHQLKEPEPLTFKSLDEPDLKIIDQDEEVASETESLHSDEEEDEEEALEREKGTQEQYLWPGVMDSIIFRFCSEFTILSCLMNKKDRKVYKAIRKSDQKQCVIIVADDHIKRLNGHGVPREIRIMRRLRDKPNLAQILGWCPVDKKKYCILLPHYPNCNMLLSTQGNLYLISKIIRSILTGVKNMHEAQVVHRDLAKDNVLWNAITEEAVIIDFDTAAPLREKYYSHVGRDTYDAPEKAEVIALRKKMWEEDQRKPEGKQKTKFYGKQADIYSVGVIFWMLLNEKGHSPEPTLLRKWVKKAIQRHKTKKYPEIDLLVKMLAFDPKSRITVEAALEHAFLQETEPDDLYRKMKRYVLKMNELPVPEDLIVKKQTKEVSSSSDEEEEEQDEEEEDQKSD